MGTAPQCQSASKAMVNTRFIPTRWFFVEDPHELYKHWPADVWQAVTEHEVKPGMNELQADFAVGMGVPDAGASSNEKTVRYPNGGKPLVVVYHQGKATEIKAGLAGR